MAIEIRGPAPAGAAAESESWGCGAKGPRQIFRQGFGVVRDGDPVCRLMRELQLRYADRGKPDRGSA